MPARVKPAPALWWMNHVANPFVRAVLCSPLHGLFSADLLLLTYRGIKSGRVYTLPVQYVRNGNTVIVVPGMPEMKTWWRNIRQGTPVELLLCGEKMKGTATRIVGSQEPTEAAELTAVYLRRYPAYASMYGIRRTPDGSFEPQSVQAAASGMIFLSMNLES